MGVIHPGWALASLILMIASIVGSILIYLFLQFCYYPGGRKRSDVIDIGELPKYDMAPQGPPQGIYEEQPTGSQFSRQETETEPYYEQRLRAPARFRETESDELPVRRGVQMMEI